MRTLLRSSSTVIAPWVARGLLAAGLFATADVQAQAQPPTNEHAAADVTMARQLGNQGLELAGAGDCGAALDLLSRSEALHHAPTTLAILGECHITLGKLVEGVEELTRVVRESLDEQSPGSFRAAQDRARVRLEEARPRIPKLRLVVHGATANAALKVHVDGESIPVASLGLDRPVDPGHHRVEVSASGYDQASGEVTLGEGETQVLTLELVRLPETDSASTTDGVEGATGKVSSSVVAALREPRSKVPAYVAFGIGAAGIAAGSAFGVFTLSKTASLDKLCPTVATCPAIAQSDIDLSKATAWTSTISFGVGAAALLAGLYFAFRGHGSSPALTARNAASMTSLQPSFAFGSTGFSGSF